MLTNEILLTDLDGTVRQPASGATFINDPYDQIVLRKSQLWLHDFYCSGYKIVGITNQGGVKAGYKSLQSCFLEQRYTLELCPQIEKIYLSIDDEECWVITRGPRWLYRLPDWINTPWLWRVDSDNPRNFLGGFRKPNPGMLKLAIAQAESEYCEGLISPWDLAQQFGVKARPSDYKIKALMVGDRDEDQQAAKAAGVDFVWVDELSDARNYAHRLLSNEERSQ